MKDLTAIDPADFDLYTEVAANGCKVWVGSTNESGYGKFLDVKTGEYRIASRFAYERKFGKLPDFVLVCHRCDNPPCVEETHLFEGTHKLNNHDMIIKRRGLHGEKYKVLSFERLRFKAPRRRTGKSELPSGISRRQFYKNCLKD